ncbi:MAG TPA: peptide-methionine (S)-S-oxide reductase MsrA [Vicinamibacterales bacterium]
MKSHRWILVVAVVLSVGYIWLRGGFVGVGFDAASLSGQTPQDTAATSPAAAQAKTGLARAIFASGCFWCTEADFDKVPGVVSTTSGYIGGQMPNPDYKSVTTGRTGHAEAVQVIYDPSVVTYEKLLDHYWRNVDPFTAHRQFCDVGTQYRPEIFVFNAEQRAAAEASKARVQQRFKEQAVVVAISNAGPFYPAEEYHQDYYKKNSAQYRFYRYGCGRDRRLQAIWGEEP